MSRNIYGASALTGGGTGALDAINGAVLADKDFALVATDTAFYIYRLNATSGATETSPGVIAPDSNAGDKRWVLIQSYSGQSTTWEAQTATDGQTVFTLSSISYATGVRNLLVVLNGNILVLDNGDYTETSTTSVTLASPAVEGDKLFFLSTDNIAVGDFMTAVADAQAAQIATAADAASTAADAVATAADRVQTGLDAASTAADAVATAADRVQTGLDAASTAADAISTAADADSTAADKADCAAYASSASDDASSASTDADRAETAQAACEVAGDITVPDLPDIPPALAIIPGISGIVDPRLISGTTRASTATDRGADGLIKTAAINDLRVDHDADCGCLGYLIEESRTNLLTYSEQFDDAAWSKTKLTITADDTVAPDGESTADLTVETAESGNHYVGQSGTMGAGDVTGSVFAKAGTRNYVWLQLYNATDDTVASTIFNLTTGAASNISGSYSVEEWGGGWWRFSVSGTATAANSTFYIYTKENSSASGYLGDGSGIYIWGAQLEEGTFPTSYTRTTSAAVTRAADLVSCPLGPWFRENEGTILLVGTPLPGSSGGHWLYLDDGSSSNYHRLYASGSTLYCTGTGGMSMALGTITAGTQFKAAFAWKENDCAACLDGGTVATDTSATMPTGLTDLRFGRYDYAFLPEGHVSTCIYWPKRFTGAKLQGLTEE